MPTVSETLDKSNEKSNRLKCYLALDREYKLAGHLFTVRHQKQRQIQTKY